MKRYGWLTILMTLALLLGCVGAASAEIIPPHGEGQIGLQATVLCDKLTLRREPSASSAAVQTLRYRDLIIVMQQTNGWAYCVTGDSEDAPAGWVNSDFIAIDPAWYRTEAQTPVYAWNDTSAPKLALLDANTQLLDPNTYLAILKQEGEWILVSLRGASGWIYTGSGTSPVVPQGDRYEGKIMIEGMEETVRYERIRNDNIGFEMSYDYERFARVSEPDCERFVSVYDDPGYAENFLEISFSPEDPEAAAETVRKAFAIEYEVAMEWTELDSAGRCIRINASEVKGGGRTADQMREVYVIPTEGGSIVAAENYSAEGADGFGTRFDAMMSTFVPIGRQ